MSRTRMCRIFVDGAFEVAVFHQFQKQLVYGSDNEPRECTVAVVELENGTLANFEPTKVKFLDKPPANNHHQDKVLPESVASTAHDLFCHQFPAGLPFGLTKPHVQLRPEGGTQVIQFEDASDVGVIRSGVYPRLTFDGLQAAVSGTPIAATKLQQKLVALIQTESETKFFKQYDITYSMFTAEVPVLIPQAWIQWHSLKKDDLRAAGSSYAADLYRVDFVAFWNDRRFAILIDDISHYANKAGNRWDANETQYANRLKEDRKLRKEGWDVFRVSNWEIRNDGIPEILVDLRSFLGF